MSMDALKWAFSQKELTMAQKIVLLALANRVKGDDKCWPSNKTLCSDAAIKQTALFEALKALTEKGLISRLSGKQAGKASTYVLVGVPHPKEQEGDDIPTRAMQQGGDAPNAQGGSHSATGGIRQTDGGYPPNGEGIRQTETGIRQTETGIRQTETGIRQTETGIRQTEFASIYRTKKEPKREPKIEPKEEKSALVPSARRATHTFGEYSHVRMTDEERRKLEIEYGPEMAQAAITFLDEYIEEKPAYAKKTKNHYLAIRRWVINAVREKHGTMKRPQTEWELKQEQQRRFDEWYMEKLNERDKGRNNPRSADGCEFVREFSD